jgi:nucleoside phosphorylase
MSLNDLMDLWQRSGESVRDEEPRDPEFRNDHDDYGSMNVEGEQDDNDYNEADENELPGLAVYRSFIRAAPAYSWFLDNLRKECILVSPEPNVIGEIRSTIMKRLPSSPRISRRNPADVFDVSFVIDWDPMAFLREQEYTEKPEIAIERAITLTGSTASAQALTCGQYLRQTWPSTGETILGLIKSLVSDENKASGMYFNAICKDISRRLRISFMTATLLNGTSLTVSKRASQSQGSSSVIWVDARGTAACIAEVGEQLAWLASALRSSPYPQKIAYSRAFIEGIQIGHVTYEETSTGATYICKIGVKLHQGQSDSEAVNGECWHQLFGSPVVVEGFPIPRRSENDSSGLEIPLNIMAGLAQARRISHFDGKTVLKGFAAMLLPMKCIPGMVIWHLVHSKNGERVSYIETGNFDTADIIVPELESSRHILGWCPEIKSYAGKVHSWVNPEFLITNSIPGAANATYLIKGSRLPRPSERGALSSATISMGHLVTGGVPYSEGRKDVRLRRNSYIVRMKWFSQKFVMLWDVGEKRGWLVNGASALLHLVRASLAQDQFDSNFAALCLFSRKEFQEASQPHQAGAALEVLLNPSNLKLKIYPENEGFIVFKDYVQDFSDILEKMLDYQLRATNQGASNNVPRSLLEGWDFNDLTTGRDPIYPREALLDWEALSWVDFTRSIHTVTLFGRGFGEIIQPAGVSCSTWAKMPPGKSYLAASASDLHQIMEYDGDPYSVPMRLTNDILWYTSQDTFAECQCKSTTEGEPHRDLAQVLLPYRLHGEVAGSHSQLPTKGGAVIFGQNSTEQWFWGDNGDPSRTPIEITYVSSQYKEIYGPRSDDSGIGRSLSPLASTTGIGSRATSEPDDHASSSSLSSSTHNGKYNTSRENSASPPLARHYKVGIVCALHIELMAVRASFDKTYKKVAISDEDPNYYALGIIEGHNVAAVCLPHGVYGTNAAADVTSNMKRSFPGLKFCLLVGVGAGVPSQKNDIRLGDVVISTPKGGYSGVLPYDMIKSSDSGASELNGYLCPPPQHLMCAISELESDPSRSSTPLLKYLQQIEDCQSQYSHPGVAHDRLFESHYVHNDVHSSSSCDKCDSACEIRRFPRPSTHPLLHYGLIASGNQVMKSAKIRDKLGQEHNVLCFEMEGAGIMNNFPCLIIRGICDYADSHKNKRWQNYAAATAAAYAKLLLSRLRTADSFELELSEPHLKKRTRFAELDDEDQPATKRKKGW